MEEDKSLLIKNVLASDEGIYICEAQNTVGQISARAQLTVNCKFLFIFVKFSLHHQYSIYLYLCMCIACAKKNIFIQTAHVFFVARVVHAVNMIIILAM